MFIFILLAFSLNIGSDFVVVVIVVDLSLAEEKFPWIVYALSPSLIEYK